MHSSRTRVPTKFCSKSTDVSFVPFLTFEFAARWYTIVQSLKIFRRIVSSRRSVLTHSNRGLVILSFRLVVDPVEKLSRTTTWWPCFSNLAVRQLPINPAPPVTRTFVKLSLPLGPQWYW